MAGDRWTEVSPSQFTHEAEGLQIVRRLLPDEPPFRAWSNFEFRDGQGRWHEVDLLVLTRDTLHLVEMKYYSGVLHGDDHRWLRAGKRAEDSPLKLARRKAQYFKSKLVTELDNWARERGAHGVDPREIVPFVKESVFLHHPNLRCELSESSKLGLYGLDGSTHSHLPGISELLLAPPRHKPIGANQEEILAQLIARLGLVQRREREAGSWVITDSAAVDEGSGWQEWFASHRVAHQEQARIRFQTTPADAAESERQRVRMLADHEFRIMSRLHHDGLVCPRDIVDSDLGVGLVYDHDDQWRRLDLWMADREGQLPLTTQLSVVRQIGEALQYAHSNKVVHRSLTPRAVWVRELATDDEVKVKVSDWHGSGVVDGGTSLGPGVTSLMGAQTGASSAGMSDESDAEQWASSSFRAPEGVWNAAADRVRLDVFGLGALAFYILTGRGAASSAIGLRDRLRAQDGLDVSVELSHVSSELRNAILRATNPSPTKRLGDVSAFLQLLAQAERAAATPDDSDDDPLDALPGAVLSGRFELIQRLGKGSTAVGLLVRDLLAPEGTPERVLKVALNDDAAARLVDEAEVLRGLRSPRLVKLVDGPLSVGERRALLLESAGTETLTDALRARDRLSIDLLQRFGQDLLDAVVTLDNAGIDHRDIKPSNLGVLESRSDRTKHLVLFDFSLTRAAASATSAGTPPYLDPFLGGQRDRFDSAAERYSAAVVLFEMATGATPAYGDGQADPATIPDEATISPEMFDPSLAGGLTAFFRVALARDVSKRHHTAQEMRAAWSGVFTDEATTEADENADALAEAAELTTPLPEAGLTPRALSAVEPYALVTVADLLALDSVVISRMPGVRNATRLQVSRRVKAWRKRLGSQVRPSRTASTRTAEDSAQTLLDALDGPGAKTRIPLVRLVFGFGEPSDAFATHAQLAATLDVTAGRISQLFAELQHVWAQDAKSRELLDELAEGLTAELAAHGGVLTYAEAVKVVASIIDPSDDPTPDEQLIAGVLRWTLERVRARRLADDDDLSAVVTRRRDGRVTLLATEQALLDVAEGLGREADALVSADSTHNSVVPAERALKRLETVSKNVNSASLTSPERLTRLAAATSTYAATTAAGDLHHRDLSPVTAVRLTFQGFAAGEMTPEEVRRRVNVRFPALAALPSRPELDRLLHEAGLHLVFDDRLNTYRTPLPTSDTTGLESRRATRVTPQTNLAAPIGQADRRLEQSISSRSFLAVGVPAGESLSRFTRTAEDRYSATIVDLTDVLLEALRAESERAGLPWETVLAADAATPDSRERQGLAALMTRVWPTVEGAVQEAVAAGGDGPVVIAEAAPLARYGNLAMLTRWTELAAPRNRAVWLVVPQLPANWGALLDGRPIPLDSPAQFVRVDHEWIDAVMSRVSAASKE
ncbi:serine/threonine protein kinase [Yimella lutea]|uniref:Serine/threonine protein kinase n=1 Tax=Yimella lutea TaxID=587872 RepID=A0A542EIZ1_9MICO|nr:BREX system serine/threonine kinase PglW [Yimella lutea]TQJ15293.1 serine/threonine protein kinase [Yimella lutea]